MPTVDELIHSIVSGNMNSANQTFASLLQDKINSSLDDSKIEMAQTMLGIESDEDDIDNEDDIDDEEELEGTGDDDEIQGVSD